MRRLAILLPIALVAGWSDAKRFRHFGDQLKASTGGLFGMPCSTKDTTTPTRDCYRFDPPERMTGIWFDEFYGGEFVPTGSKVPDNTKPSQRFWVDSDGVPIPFARTKAPDDSGKAYAVTIIGRRSCETGTASLSRIIVVDKWLSGHEVTRPKPGEIVR